MLASNNVLLPSNSEPYIVHQQDVVAHLYAGARADQREGEGILSPTSRKCSAPTVAPGGAPRKIQVRLKQTESVPGGEPVEKTVRVETTVGRALLEILPAGLPFATMNKTAQEEGDLEDHQRELPRCALRETVDPRRQAMQAGHALATRGGISSAADDMLIRPKSTRSSRSRSAR